MSKQATIQSLELAVAALACLSLLCFGGFAVSTIARAVAALFRG